MKDSWVLELGQRYGRIGLNREAISFASDFKASLPRIGAYLDGGSVSCLIAVPADKPSTCFSEIKIRGGAIRR